MPKRYLNKQEKNDCLVIGAFASWMQDKANRMAEHSQSKQVIRNLRTASTYGQKALDEIIFELDDLEKVKVLEEAGKMQVSTRYKDQALREFKETMELDDVVPVKKSDFYDFMECTFEKVCKCCSTPENHQDCYWRKMFIQYDVEPFNLNIEPGMCPYKVAEVLE